MQLASLAFPLQVSFHPPGKNTRGSFFFWFVPSPATQDYVVDLAQQITGVFPRAWKVNFQNGVEKVYLPRAVLAYGKARCPQFKQFLGKFKKFPGSEVLMALVRGTRATLVEGLQLFADLDIDALEEDDRVADSIRVWASLAKFALELVARQRSFPALVPSGRDGEETARWRVALEEDADHTRFEALSAALPPAAICVPVPGKHATPMFWRRTAVMGQFLDAAADALLRHVTDPGDVGKLAREEGAPATRPLPGKKNRRGVPRHPEHEKYRTVVPPWDERLVRALVNSADFPHAHYADRAVATIVDRWVAPFTCGSRFRGFRAAVQLHLPTGEGEGGETPWRLGFGVQSIAPPRVFVPAEQLWEAGERQVVHQGTTFERPRDALVLAIHRLTRVFPATKEALQGSPPVGAALDFEQACQFLTDVAPTLAQFGITVVLPPAMQPGQPQALDVQFHLTEPPSVTLEGGFDLFSVLDFQWETAIGDQTVSRQDAARFLQEGSPLVQVGGEWVYVAPEKRGVLAQVASGQAPRELNRLELMQGTLAGEVTLPGLQDPVKVVMDARISAMMEQLRTARGISSATGVERPRGLVPTPLGFHGELRPYQVDGLTWLNGLCAWGFGACLADDMGLGKTIQVIAYFLHRKARSRVEHPTLVVCPTSVLWNWEAEIHRFAPELTVAVHSGRDRPQSARALQQASRDTDVVLTTYGITYRDRDVLEGVPWEGVVIDEAQNIKNPQTKQARAVKAFPARYRVALSGTPVENRLQELWSIFDFLNPGFLGTRAGFRKKFALPIERFRDEQALLTLKRLIDPFILRRRKSDDNIAPDLPEKEEIKMVTPLTPEQAALYQERVQATMREIEAAEGIERKGLVLSLLTKLKQISNHPAQFLKEDPEALSIPALVARSGKMQRLVEMCREIVAAREKVLIFTQYTTMAEILQRVLAEVLAKRVLYLHGGVPSEKRQDLVTEFQEDPLYTVPAFVISLRAGGTGLNLTSATYVIHYDRWWNPAVEDQATDRAYRIGQERNVRVYKYLARGTVEDKIDRLIEEKKELAETVVSGGEAFITEFSDEDLEEIFALQAEVIDEPGEDAE